MLGKGNCEETQRTNEIFKEPCIGHGKNFWSINFLRFSFSYNTWKRKELTKLENSPEKKIKRERKKHKVEPW